MSRNCELTYVENDESFKLQFIIDNKIVAESLTVYCFEDILIMSAEFLSDNCEKFEVDTRFDLLAVNLNYKFNY